MLRNILILTAIILIIIGFNIMDKKDQANGEKWDKCVAQFKATNDPSAMFETEVKNCYEGNM